MSKKLTTIQRINVATISPKTGKPYRKQTKLQKLSSQENFALFLLKGMQGQLAYVRKVIPESICNVLESDIKLCTQHIKYIQQSRKKDKDNTQ